MKKHVILVALFTITLAQAQEGLYVGVGAKISTTGNSTITLNNVPLNNNGTLTDASGTLQFTGTNTTENTSIKGTGTTNFNHLKINKTSNSVQLDQDVGIAGELNLLSGGLSLNNGNINLGTTGTIINETATNTVFGTGGSISSSFNLNAPSNQNIGGQGVLVTTTKNLGATAIARSNSNTTIGGGVVLRIYSINPTNNASLNGTLAFTYMDEELDYSSEEYLNIYQTTDNGTNWNLLSSTTNKTSNQVSINNLQSFTQYALVESNPITLSNQTLSTANTISLYKQNQNLVVTSKEATITNIAIYSVLGKNLKQQSFNTTAQTAIINTQNIASGVYIISIQLANGTLITKKTTL